MFIMMTVASVCVLVTGIGVVRLACRHRSDLWIVSQDSILIIVSPAIILLGTFGAVSLGWRLTHGGLTAVTTGGWIGSLAIVAVSIGIWRVLAVRIRQSAKARAIVAASAVDPVPAHS